MHKKRDVPHNIDLHMLSKQGEKEQIPELYLQSKPVKIQRLRDRRTATVEAMIKAKRVMGNDMQVLADAWTVDDIPGPNVTDKDTILALAYMTYDAYYLNETDKDWEDVGGGFNRSLDVGWEGNGLRGHVFTNEDNSTVVLGLKGTTPGYWDSDKDTTKNDKTNDNLFASCCCAQQGPTGAFWKQVCDCATGTYSCNQTCLIENLRDESKYYSASRELFSNVSALYPSSNIWIAGHSLGGLVSSLLGLTYGVPVVTFEAVPDALAASRLGLPEPPNKSADLSGAYHIGHTADPVYMGSCGGATDSCTLFGYAFEGSCHTGRRCVYDTVADKNMGVHIWWHPIVWVINNVLKTYDNVPECEPEPECVDCYNWKFYESHNRTTTTTTSTTTSSTRTRTRTSTCKTPGWWGCLDETTTTTTGDTTTTSSSTSTCKTKGWFGCLDPITTTTVITTSDTTTTSTSTCKTPGWFGACNDPTTTMGTGAVFPEKTESPNGDDWRSTHTAMITAAPRYEM